jgi:hypothetical protein
MEKIAKYRQINPKSIPHQKLLAELHWYEAHGIGKRKMKIKRFLE